MLIACLVLFILGILFEAVKRYRVQLQQRHRSAASRDQDDVLEQFESSSTSADSMLQTALFLVQLSIGYALMLAVMTFSVWLGVAVLLGTGTGFCLFAATSSMTHNPG